MKQISWYYIPSLKRNTMMSSIITFYISHARHKISILSDLLIHYEILRVYIQQKWTNSQIQLLTSIHLNQFVGIITDFKNSAPIHIKSRIMYELRFFILHGITSCLLWNCYSWGFASRCWTSTKHLPLHPRSITRIDLANEIARDVCYDPQALPPSLICY